MRKGRDVSTILWISKGTGRNKIYIGMLLLVQMILGISSVYYAVLLRDVIDAAADGERREFFLMMAVFAGLVLFQIALRAVSRFLEEFSRATMENRFKTILFEKLLSQEYEKVMAVHSGAWINRLTSDTVVVADGLTQIIPGAAGMLVKLTGALALIFVMIPAFGYILVPGGILLIVFTYVFRKVLKGLHKKMQEKDGALRIFLQESLSSMLVIRAFVKEMQTLEIAVKNMEEHKKARMKKNHFSNLCNVGFGSVMHGAYVLGAGICGYGILMGTMSYGTLMAILQLIGQIQSPFANITGYLPKYYAMVASAERLREIETESECSDCTGKRKESAEIQEFYKNRMSGITLEHVDFTYQPLKEESKEGMPVILRDLNLNIQKGEYVAFTGPSGCGKSTVLKLMLCLYQVDAGQCYIDLISSQKRILLDASYRRLFAYVPQGNYLMSGTIREIVTFSCETEMQNEERIWKVLDIACAREFVMELAQGIDTLLGERGMGLSEGQMQRIAIARAIYADNPILMLDESTSALDEVTEKRLLGKLRTMTDKTVMIVTHRSAVLEICDKEVMFAADGCREKEGMAL